MRLIQWFRTMVGLGQVCRKIDVVKMAIDKAAKKKDKTDRELELLRREVLRLSSAIDRAQEANNSLQVALDTAQAKLQVAEEVTIPSLVAAHAMLAARWEAETAIITMRSTATKLSQSQDD